MVRNGMKPEDNEGTGEPCNPCMYEMGPMVNAWRLVLISYSLLIEAANALASEDILGLVSCTGWLENMKDLQLQENILKRFHSFTVYTFQTNRYMYMQSCFMT